jgi:Tfp pilus assembly protein PilV
MRLTPSFKNSGGVSGMTIVEAMVAMVILSFTMAAVVHLIVTGDRISGRRSGLSYATILAQSEAERLRSYEKSLVLPNDTLYTQTTNGIAFTVSRKRIQNTTGIIDTLSYREYAVVVKRIGGIIPLTISLRLLQGFTHDISK